MQYKRPKDMQRERVYAAERSMPWYVKDHRFETVEQAQEWLHERVLALSWFRARWPSVVHVRVEAKHHGLATAQPTLGLIRMPRKQLSKAIVIHELAHLCASREEAWHGRDFCLVFLELINRCLGYAEGDQLRDAFIKHRVKFHAKRAGRVLTTEQREALADRLKKAREVKAVHALARLASNKRSGRIFVIDHHYGVERLV